MTAPSTVAKKQPDHRHLRRAAEALSGRDDDTDVWVAVHVTDEVPFGCLVFDTLELAQEHVDRKARLGATWVVIPSHSEVPELSTPTEKRFVVVTHDETSPLTATYVPGVDPDQVQGMSLLLDLGHGAEMRVPLTAHLQGQPDANVDRPKPTVDAIFLTLEAMDKYVFPNLVYTYGTPDARLLRRRMIAKLDADARADGATLSPQFRNENEG
jgi:hypothetical protein